MKSQPEILRDRTKQFAIGIVRLVRIFPSNEESRIIGRQLMRSATSVAANYRAVCRARSKAEFIPKIGIVVGTKIEEARKELKDIQFLQDRYLASEQGFYYEREPEEPVKEEVPKVEGNSVEIDITKEKKVLRWEPRVDLAQWL